MGTLSKLRARSAPRIGVAPRFASVASKHMTVVALHQLTADLERAARRFERALEALGATGIVDAVPRLGARSDGAALHQARSIVEASLRDEERLGGRRSDVRLTRLAALQAIERARSQAEGPAQPVELATDGRWFRAGDGEVVTLAHRPVLARVLAALARSAPFAVHADALVAAAWPGERMVTGAGLVRLRVAVATLRRLGLERHIVTSKSAEGASYALVGVAELVDESSVAPHAP